METLVRAIERASYARYGTRDFGSAEMVTDAATAVRAALLSSVTPSRRVLGLLAPRSLIVRPGQRLRRNRPCEGERSLIE